VKEHQAMSQSLTRPTVKAGVPHVIASDAILRQIWSSRLRKHCLMAISGITSFGQNNLSCPLRTNGGQFVTLLIALGRRVEKRKNPWNHKGNQGFSLIGPAGFEPTTSTTAKRFIDDSKSLFSKVF
jgi:hypothetical protein